MDRQCLLCKKTFRTFDSRRRYCDSCKNNIKERKQNWYQRNKERCKELHKQWLESPNGIEYRERIAKRAAERWANASEEYKEHVRVLRRARYRRIKEQERQEVDDREDRGE